MINKITNSLNPQISDEKFAKIYEVMIWTKVAGVALLFIIAASYVSFPDSLPILIGIVACSAPDLLNMVNTYMIFAPGEDDETS